MNKLITLFLLIPLSIQAQEGKYKGNIDIQGNALPVEFSLTKEGNWKGSMDIPAQGAKGLILTDIKADSDSVVFKIDEVPGGAIVRSAIKGDSLKGRFSQNGMSFPFYAVKSDDSEKIGSAIAALKIEIDSLREKLKVPGASIGIWYKGEIILNEGFGYRNVALKQKADEHTVYAIGSSSKAFTAALLAKAIDADSIEWDEPVIYRLPGFGMKDEFANNEINAVDLLTHRSGLPRHDLLWYGTSLSREQLLQKIRFLEPSEPFRTSFQYQNLMYLTAGYLVGKIYNSTWEEELQKQLFDPLGMTSSGYHLSSLKGNKNGALPYGKRKEGVVEIPFRNIDAIGPAGSINSTSTDMLKWVSMLLNNGKINGKEVLNENIIRHLFRPYIYVPGGGSPETEMTPAAYGLGWFINYYKGHRIVKHGGNIDGYTALVFLMPEDDLGIVVLTNKNVTGFNELVVMNAVDKILELGDRNWFSTMYPRGISEDDEDEDKNEMTYDNPKGPYFEQGEYAGKYKNDVYGTITVENTKDGLKMKTEAFEFEMKHYNMETFAVHDVSNDNWDKLTFRSGTGGQIEYIEYVVDPSVDAYKFYKLPDEDLKKPEYLSKFTGKYDMDKIMITVVLEGDKLMAEPEGQSKVELEPTGKNMFQLKGLKGFQIEFLMNKKGKVTTLISHQPNGDFEGKRVE